MSEGGRKELAFVRRSAGRHWVGDGFPVQTIFSYQDIAEQISPFLVMDYGGPAEFMPTEARRGVGEHPHRGFETVTLVYAGQVEHRDSAGGGGIIQSGDVQWMTAAAGLVHEEFHGPDFAKNGGRFEMVQLWINLPAKDKSASPRYQGIRDAQIPRVALAANGEDSGTLRVIAGQFTSESGSTARGPALTFSPVELWDAEVKAGQTQRWTIKEGRTAALFVRQGKIQVGAQTIGEAELGVLETSGTQLEFTPLTDTQLLFLGGEPLGEPIVGYGPFVMNSVEEIRAAIADFENGKMGNLRR